MKQNTVALILGISLGSFLGIWMFLATIHGATIASQYLPLINPLRVSKLTESSPLNVIAQKRATYLCTHPFSQDGWVTWFDNTTYSYIGENLAKGYTSPFETMRAWIASSEHRTNLLNTRFTQIGMAEECGVTVQLFAN